MNDAAPVGRDHPIIDLIREAHMLDKIFNDVTKTIADVKSQNWVGLEQDIPALISDGINAYTLISGLGGKTACKLTAAPGGVDVPTCTAKCEELRGIAVGSFLSSHPLVQQLLDSAIQALLSALASGAL